MRERRIAGALLASGLALALAASPGAGAAADPTAGSAAPTAPPSSGVPAVLDPAASNAPAPTDVGLAAALEDLLDDSALGRRVGLSIVDVATGMPLFGQAPTRPVTPASTTKILTAASVLAALGPDARLHTTVVREPARVATAPPGSPEPALEPTPEPADPPAAPRIVLVGGGDPTLTSLPPGDDALPDYPASSHLDDLAAQTARALRADGTREVRLRYDASLFTGPADSPEWEPGYTSDVVARVAALSADQGRLTPESGSRVLDPAAQTAELFAAELGRRGIDVLGEAAEARAPQGAAVIADVASAPMSALVESMLVTSDNDAAEALARHAAIARGLPGSFTGGATAARDTVAVLGIDTAGLTLHDGSGLSRQNLIPPLTLARVLAAAAAGPDLRLRPLASGLAVAGVNGTLALHFDGSRETPARGFVRAKSGSLTGVVSLGGLAPTADGRLLAFDMAADAVRPGAGLAAREVIERVTAVLVACGCP